MAKKEDLGPFTIPCTIGVYQFDKAYNLGPSINLTPLAIIKKLGLGAPKSTTKLIELRFVF